MRFSKTFCKPAATVSIVPVGLPVKLEYNENGLLKKFTIGFSIYLDPSYNDPDAGEYNYNELFERIKRFVPKSISTTGGTTWVYGVFYSDNIPCDEGILPQALYKSYIKDIISGGSYKFYAGYVHSLAASFKGPLVIRNFLSLSKFETLPQVIVPVNMSNETLQMAMNPGTYPFKHSYIAGFLIFEDTNCRYSATNLLQINVAKDIDPFVDSDGYLKGEITTESGRTYKFNYSAIVHHGVSKGCSLLVERDDANSNMSILSTRLGVNVERVIDNSGKDAKCPVCGKVYRVGQNDAPVQCDDPHCLSHLYNDAVRFLTILNLPTMSYNSYKALVDSKKIICLTDLLELPPCREQEIKTTLATAMYALTPTSAVPNFDVLERFANKCNNSVETVVYYLQNPRRIETDLDITDPIIRRLVVWLEDPYNVSSLITLFSRIKIDAKLQKFDGAPIFRGNTFVITGKFKRGDYNEIASIIRSYAAEVIPSIEKGKDLPDGVIVGSLHDGVSGEVMQKAKLHGIPIMEEDDFFVRYEIDQDLANNLL